VKKRIIIASSSLLLVIIFGAAVVFSGVLTIPTRAALATDTPVEEYDILDAQFQREQEILADYKAGAYTPENPYIIQDPYQANPLSAMVLFETTEPTQVTVEIPGKDQFTTYQYTYSAFSTHHEVAILGLYAARTNPVHLLVSNQQGQKQTIDLSLKTESLPFDFPNRNILVSKPEKMEPGLELMTPCFETSYTYLLDADGDVRAYFTNRYFGHGTSMFVLQNGHLLATGDLMKLMPYNMYTLWEWNLLGKVFTEYEIPNAIHHDIIELKNGDFLAVSNNKDMPYNYDTREDVLVRIDRQTGLVKKEYDLRKVLDDRREPYQHFDPGILHSQTRDWAHTNAVAMDENTNSIFVSSPIQSTVVKMDANTMAIDWILSSPEGWDGEFSRFQKYLIKPAGQPFEWQWGQHAIMLLPDEDHDPNTIDLLMFDNGQSRSYIQATSIDPDKNYSRAVIFRVNETNRTVEQIWEYGKDLGAAGYATFLGDADLLEKTGNINIAFGGMLRKDGVPVDDIVMGVLGKQNIQSRVSEVRRDGEVVFDVSVTPNQSSSSETYQVEKINLYNSSMDYSFGQIKGTRKGEIQSAKMVDTTIPKFFIPRLTYHFNKIYTEKGYLVMQGSFQYQNKTYLLGKVMFILKNKDHQYIFNTNSGLNGSFYGRIDLSQVVPGEYAIYGAGGVVGGNDAAGKIQPGYNPTGYKITVP
jgi:arylsulfate sulfotransferase